MDNDLTPEAEAAQIMGDMSGPYWNAKDPIHKQTVERVTGLMQKAHGDDAAIDEGGDSKDLERLMQDTLRPPETSSEYDFTGIEFADEAEEAEARGWFEETGLSVQEQKQFTKQALKVSAMSPEAREKILHDASQTLQRSWGSDFDNNVEKVERMIDRLGPNFRTMLINSGMNNDVAAINALLSADERKGV